MCGGFVEDVFDAVGDVIEDVGDFIGDTVEAVVENPIGAIVSVGGMALGIPPVYAGALGGAANAAANGGNILEGALTGGAMGYVGGVAGQAAANAGAGAALSGAAGGAAAGAAGAALTGQDILQGALQGGALGGAAGYVTGGAPTSGGNQAPVYDYNPNTGGFDLVSPGSVVTTPTTGGTQPPVYDWNPATGNLDLASIGNMPGLTPNLGIGGNLPADWRSFTGQWDPTSGNMFGFNDVVVAPDSGTYAGDYGPGLSDNTAYNPGQELNILTEQQTADLMKNVDPRLINALQDTGPVAPDTSVDTGADAGVDSGTDVPFRVEVGGLPGTIENPGYANSEFRTPGTDLASFADIDAGRATWNPAANAWEVGAKLDYSSFNPTESLPGAFGEPPTGTPTTPTTTPSGPSTYTFDDGSTITFKPDGTTTYTDPVTGVSGSHRVETVQGGTGGGATYTYDDGTWLTINPDGSSMWTDTNGGTHTNSGGTYTAPNGGTPTDLGEITITAPKEPTVITDPTDLGDIVIVGDRPVKPTEPPTDLGDIVIVGDRPVTETPVITPPVVEPPVVEPPITPEPPVVEPPVVEPPIDPVFPVIPVTPTPPVTPPPTPYTPKAGTPLAVKTDYGLNPGWIQAVPMYQTTNDVQSQYYWGGHPFQGGQTFNPQLAQSGYAPATPWGQQQQFRQLTPQEVALAAQGRYLGEPAAAPATRWAPYTTPIGTQTVAGPVAPV